ncbi:Proteasome subunit alpha type-6 [Binucleata daphniae]
MALSDYNYFSTFSPDGTLKPLSHLRKSHTLGTTALAITSPSFGLIIAQKQTKKVFKISDNSLFTFSGITNDGLHLVNYLINKQVEANILKNRNINLQSFDDFLYDAGMRLMMNGSRPFGVKGLYISYTDKLTLFEIDSEGVNECKAMSIGERGQSARTVLEKEVHDNMSEEEVINVGIKAIKNALTDITKESVEMYGIKESGCYEIDVSQYFE